MQDTFTPGMITYRQHDIQPELGILCLICSHGLEGWSVAIGLPGSNYECSECGHYLWGDEQKRFNQWLAWRKTGTHVMELSVQGIENYAMTTAGFVEAENYRYLIAMIRDLQTTDGLVQAANARLNKWVQENTQTIEMLTERLRGRLEAYNNYEGR